jgi:hypothetical protein
MISQSVVTVTRLLSVAALGLVLAACASLKVGQDFDRSSNFSGYRAFSWMPREHHGTRNPLVAQRARDAIQAELTRKGFSYVEDAAAADFVVDFTIGARERMDIHSYPAPYADPWGWGRAGWWGNPYWGNEVNVRNYREGTLSIDVFDAHTHKAAWHGWAKKELSQADIDRSEAPIRAAVAAVLELFPPK